MNRSVASSTDARPSFGTECVAVFVGGFAGALARYGLLELYTVNHDLWLGPIFLANIAGCAILGYVIARRGPGLQVSLIGTGFCGALTTFSTIQLEFYRLIEEGFYFTAAVNIVLTIFFGLLAVTSARRFVDRGKELA
jgi:CrcB protein